MIAKEQTADPINPQHYKRNGIECIEVIEIGRAHV